VIACLCQGADIRHRRMADIQLRYALRQLRQLLPCGDAADIQRPQLGEACQVKALRLCLRQSAARQLRMACGISVA